MLFVIERPATGLIYPLVYDGCPVGAVILDLDIAEINVSIRVGMTPLTLGSTPPVEFYMNGIPVIASVAPALRILRRQPFTIRRDIQAVSERILSARVSAFPVPRLWCGYHRTELSCQHRHESKNE